MVKIQSENSISSTTDSIKRIKFKRKRFHNAKCLFQYDMPHVQNKVRGAGKRFESSSSPPPLWEKKL